MLLDKSKQSFLNAVSHFHISAFFLAGSWWFVLSFVVVKALSKIITEGPSSCTTT